MTAITALLLFTLWTLVLMFTYVGYRVVMTLTLKKRADTWGRDLADVDPAFIVRAKHAHLNSAENLPIFAAIVLSAHFLGKAPVVDAVAMWVFYLRVAQSLTHLAGRTHWHIFVRANFFTLQALLYLYMIWGLFR